MPRIEIDRLSKHFGAVPVIEELSLRVEDKDFLVLLGPSGCGKSTLLNIIAGLEPQTRGSIRIGGRDVSGLEPKDRGLSMVFQSYALYPTMTVRQNMSFGLKVAGMAREQIAQRVDRAAQMLQLVPLLDRKPGQLSGGQRQRAAIGRALVRDVGVFLFDEPLSNLDAKLRTEMRSEIRRLHDTLGVTSVYVTHDQVEAMTMATRIAVMKGGVVQQLGTPQDLYDRPANLFVAGFIGTTAMNLLAGALEGGPGTWTARCGDARLPLAGYPFAQAPRAGTAVTIGLRPENLRPVGPGDAGVPGLAGDVEQVEPMGADSLVWVRWNGQRLALRTTPARALTLRGTVALALDAERLSVFDPQTQQRL